MDALVHFASHVDHGRVVMVATRRMQRVVTAIMSQMEEAGEEDICALLALVLNHPSRRV